MAYHDTREKRSALIGKDVKQAIDSLKSQVARLEHARLFADEKLDSLLQDHQKRLTAHIQQLEQDFPVSLNAYDKWYGVEEKNDEP